MKRRPLRTVKSFAHAHFDQQERLRRYTITGRGRHHCDEVAWNSLKDGEAKSLKATNARARVELAAAVWHALGDVPGIDANDRPYFISLAPRAFAMPLSQASLFDVSAIVDWSRRVLGSGSFIGAVDAALYTNFSLSGAAEPVVSWHVHAIVWRASDENVETLVDQVNIAHPPLVPGCTSAHARRLSGRSLRGSAVYMLKFPQSEYRIYPMKLETIDAETGEITNLSTGIWRQRKRALRTGDAWRLTKMMKNLQLKQLVFAGGDIGHRILRTAVRRARRQIRHGDYLQMLRLKSL